MSERVARQPSWSMTHSLVGLIVNSGKTALTLELSRIACWDWKRGRTDRQTVGSTDCRKHRRWGNTDCVRSGRVSPIVVGTPPQVLLTDRQVSEHLSGSLKVWREARYRCERAECGSVQVCLPGRHKFAVWVISG